MTSFSHRHKCVSRCIHLSKAKIPVCEPSWPYIITVPHIIWNFGCSAYGNVYRCVKRGEEDVPLAIKIIPLVTDLREIIKELSILRQCHCQNIVK